MARVKKPFSGGDDARTKALASVASTFREFRPAAEVLTRIEAVPTIFPQYDAATRVAGQPIGRFMLVHGPSNEGKSSFALGLGRSFLERGHFFAFADAERTTPPEWLKVLFGGVAQHPGFVALPVSTYEQTVDGVRDFCTKVAEARLKKDGLPEDTTGLIVIDSIRKLVPKDLMKNLMKDGATGGKKARGVDGFGGRAGQIKAALNAAWVDELIPLLADTRMAMVVIARETEDPNAGMFDDAVKIGGGSALNYDSSLRGRITHRFIRDPNEPSRIFGERHKIEIRKTKVARKEQQYPVGYFHTSNGTLTPAGFDRPRDVLEIAVQAGIVDQAGAWFRYDDESGKTIKLGQGEAKSVVFLHQNPDLCRAIENQVRQSMPREGQE